VQILAVDILRTACLNDGMRVIGVLLLAGCVSAYGVGLPPDLSRTIDRLMQQQVDAGNTPGVVVLIGRCYDDKPDAALCHKAYGWRENATADPSARERMTLDTLFDIASLTKPTLTAMAAMLLIQDGKLSADDRVATQVPGFERHGKGDVRVRHLLTHTSGLAAYTTVPSPPRPNPDALIRKICNMRKAYEPGKGSEYSCLNYIVLARAVEKAGGESIGTLLKRRLWAPIGMVDATYFPSPSQLARTAPTLRSRRGRVHDPLAYYHTDYESRHHACGNAGAFCTVRDAAQLVRLLLHNGKLRGKAILKPESVGKITHRQTQQAATTFGWHVSTLVAQKDMLPGAHALAHTGYTGTYIWFETTSKTFVIVFSNCVYPDDNRERKRAFYNARNEVVRTVAGQLGKLDTRAARNGGEDQTSPPVSKR
jgi:serine-type D-Ala-D-Ala carboxypeptidase